MIESVEVSLKRIMHVKTHLLDRIGNVKAHEHSVLKCTARLRSSVGSLTGGLTSVESLECVSIDVEHGFHSNISAR